MTWDIRWSEHHPPEKYGLKDFFLRLARDPYVSRVEMGEERGVRGSFLKPDPGDFNVLEGGVAINYRGKDNTLLFRVTCHSEASEQQDGLRDYFEKEHLNER